MCVYLLNVKCVSYCRSEFKQTVTGSKTRTRMGGANGQGADFKEVLTLRYLPPPMRPQALSSPHPDRNSNEHFGDLKI